MGAKAATPAFFSLLNDVPAMQGLYEVPEAHLFFDKPEGRIADLTVLMDGVSQEQVQVYYRETLPQFGWSAQSETLFMREGEQLRLKFEGNRILKILVNPR